MINLKGTGYIMEQLSFNIEISDERRAFELIYPHISDIIYNAPIESEILIFKEINNCSSVYYLSTNMLLFQIRLRKKSKYLLLPEKSIDEIPEGAAICKSKSDPGMIRIPITAAEDILAFVPTLRNTLNAMTKRNQSFGCCSRYEACSDAKTCIHPDVKFALGCQYRHNLMEGKIFYGKNKTID